jgi:hypothetical protein
MPRLRGPPRGQPTLSGIREMPLLPLIFDTILRLGATKLGATFLNPFLHLAKCFGTLAVVAKFSSFWAGKARRHAKVGCAIVHHCHGVSPAKKNQIKKILTRGVQNMMYGRETMLREATRTLRRETKFQPVRDLNLRIDAEIKIRQPRVAH